jgi:UDP-2,4-diacetamido-2,4,6-trideoxy-beta-L-altropyranose hydrolase
MRSAMIVADGGPSAGLGHMSRSSAIAAGARCHGFRVRCFANGLAEPERYAGASWIPFEERTDLWSGVDLAVFDSYTLDVDALIPAAWEGCIAVLHEWGDIPKRADVLVNAASSDVATSSALFGFRYAALRSEFWGVSQRREHARSPDRVLITGGGGVGREVMLELAQLVRARLPEAVLRLVHPQAAEDSCGQTHWVSAPDGLRDQLLWADIAVCAGGQTSLEAACLGVPMILIELAENQRANIERLVTVGAAVAADRPSIGAAVAACSDMTTRAAMAASGQAAVDGFGALRVAYALARFDLERGREGGPRSVKGRADVVQQ